MIMVPPHWGYEACGASRCGTEMPPRWGYGPCEVSWCVTEMPPRWGYGHAITPMCMELLKGYNTIRAMHHSSTKFKSLP